MVDSTDYYWLNKYDWNYYGRYIETYIKGETIYMHRLIMKTPKNMLVDHVNGNKLDNRRENLRNCSSRENSFHKPRKKNRKCKYKGVYRSSDGKHWQSEIGINGKRYYLGRFLDPKQAAIAYNKAAKLYHGEFAFLNII